MQALRPEGDQASFMKYFLQDPTLMENMNRKQKKKIVLYDLPQIEPFRKLNKPVVSQEKKRIIKEKLDLEQQSMLQTKQREKRNEYFLNYSENPFIELQPHKKAPKTPANKNQFDESQMNIDTRQAAAHSKLAQQVKKVKNEDRSKLIYDIVTQLNSMTEKKPQPEFINLNDNFKKIMKEADLFSNKIIEISANKEDFQFFRNKTLQTDEIINYIAQRGIQMAQQKSKKQLDKQKLQPRNRSNTLSTQDGKQTKKQLSNNPILDKIPQDTLSFDEIISIKQENFFMKPDPPQKPFNIFKVSFNKSQKQTIGKQLLDKYNFSFSSMVQKIQKIKIPIYRDISRMARRIALGISTGKDDRFDYIDSYELSFKTNALNFSDLMSVASGRFTPQFVYKTTNFDVQNTNKETSETTSQQEEQPIFYDDNTQSIGVRFQNKGEEQQQIINYLKLEYNSKQKSYQAQCQQYKHLISSDLGMKEKLVSTTIQDKALHGILNRSIKKQLKQFVNMDEKDIEIDRLIRMNKMNKNKNVAIKLGKVVEAFQLKTNHNDVIEKLGILEDDQDFDDDDPDNYLVKDRGQSPVKLKKLNPVFQQPVVGSNTHHRRCCAQHLNSHSPQKRQTNLSKTPQKKTTESRVNSDKSPLKNTVRKTPIWR